MSDPEATREELLDEISRLRAELARHERAEGERRRAVEALRHSEECHRAISELTSDYAYIARLEPDGRAVLEWASDGFREVTGYTVEEAEARGGWSSFIHPDDVAAAQEGMGAALRQNRGGSGQLRLITKGGEVRWLHYSARPVWDEAEGRVARCLGAVQDITERKRAEGQLQEHARHLQALSRRLLQVQEAERRHLARELHDEVGQALTSLNLTLEKAARRGPEVLRPDLAEARGLVKDVAGRLRELSSRLRPALLDDLGLVPALRWLFERHTAQTGVRVHFEPRPLPERFPPAVETAAYRIIQEALTNVARHAGVDEAAVRLWSDGANLGAQVEDRGGGFDPAAVPAGTSSGVAGMRERAALLGGRVEIESGRGGTRVTAVLPLGGMEEVPGDAR